MIRRWIVRWLTRHRAATALYAIERNGWEDSWEWIGMAFRSFVNPTRIWKGLVWFPVAAWWNRTVWPITHRWFVRQWLQREVRHDPHLRRWARWAAPSTFWIPLP